MSECLCYGHGLPYYWLWVCGNTSETSKAGTMPSYFQIGTHRGAEN